MNNILDRTKKIIKKQFQIKNKNISSNDDLKKKFKMDSLDFIELIMLLEEEFKIELFDIETEKVKTIKDIVTYIMKKIKQKK
ncbi:Acyl carrier protein [Buchnera aphidicola (Cinara piceae)]|uniref:Acyl carrier protein n=1 Tax=Buchnera aphidicola (Cinara piceae) TaxID=1660043 RepID=A0A803FU04_9GAMM|nr:phosphopantetheine-binding protein [Buchnera aphidicola]VFP88404.1 Acyl carrier protein [Buchnera aphidicola (Cinara piceae)]